MCCCSLSESLPARASGPSDPAIGQRRLDGRDCMKLYDEPRLASSRRHLDEVSNETPGFGKEQLEGCIQMRLCAQAVDVEPRDFKGLAEYGIQSRLHTLCRHDRPGFVPKLRRIAAAQGNAEIVLATQRAHELWNAGISDVDRDAGEAGLWAALSKDRARDRTPRGSAVRHGGGGRERQ